MRHQREAFIGIDTAKLRNAVAIVEAGSKGESCTARYSSLHKLPHALDTSDPHRTAIAAKQSASAGTSRVSGVRGFKIAKA
jgi:hypothetical protein